MEKKTVKMTAIDWLDFLVLTKYLRWWW